MKNIMLSELLKYKSWALRLSLVHLGILLAVNSISSIVFNGDAFFDLSRVFYTLAFLGFGLYQIGSHIKMSRWTYLIHRPLSPPKIYTSLVIAAAILAMVVVFMPLLVIFIVSDLTSNGLVEARHYLIFPYFFALCFTVYFAACFVTLQPKKIVWVVFILILAYFPSGQSLPIQLALQYLILFWMAYLSYASFKPNLSQASNKLRHRVLTVAMVQFCCFFLLSWGHANITQIGMAIFQMHPNTNPVKDGFYQASREMDEQQKMLHGLGDHQLAAAYQVQLASSEFSAIKSPNGGMLRVQKRYQPHYVDQGQIIYDAKHATNWTFNHELMLYQGLDSKTRVTKGWLGKTGRIHSLDEITNEARFDSVPNNFSRQYLSNEKSVFIFDESLQRFHTKFMVPGKQQIRSIKQGSNFVSVLTDQQVYFFAKNKHLSSASLLTPFAQIALQRPLKALIEFQASELADGYLLSVVYGEKYDSARIRGVTQAEIVIARLRSNGELSYLNRRDYVEQYSPFTVHSEMIISPLYKTIRTALAFAIAPDKDSTRSVGQLLNSQFPDKVLLAIALMMMLSGAMTLILLRHADMSRLNTILWVVSNTLTGLPGLMSCYFVCDWRSKKLETLSLIPATIAGV